MGKENEMKKHIRWLAFAVAAMGLTLLPQAAQVAEAGKWHP